MLQLPVATLALQLWVPSLTVTVPEGVPLPGALADTVKLKLTAWPTADGSGAWPVIAVVVAAAFTVWDAPADELLPEMASPPSVPTGLVARSLVRLRGKLPATPVAVR